MKTLTEAINGSLVNYNPVSLCDKNKKYRVESNWTGEVWGYFNTEKEAVECAEDLNLDGRFWQTACVCQRRGNSWPFVDGKNDA